ncbi:hypothetical protein MLD38_039122 [Melastoma candidum]|uniref:Uncharacterized protein n=1 Tax=Melastoma candidum TaxID=119954 RepID=A0ACB9L2B3_9MYRT|nr:hypothetical protein MLD38_039122 [Melastoma candidum]
MADDSTPLALATIHEENIVHGSAKGDAHPTPDRDAVLARIEREKTLALIKAWEENEKAKAVNRAHKKLVEIGSWETNMKASVEALIKKAEEDMEKKKAEHVAKFRIKIAKLHEEVEAKRVTITSRRGEVVTKVEDQATKFRSTGYVPRDFFRMLRLLKQ